ncbi:MAG: hypothetical protein ACPF9D_11420, partial [Owenweeksia sp.]
TGPDNHAYVNGRRRINRRRSHTFSYTVQSSRGGPIGGTAAFIRFRTQKSRVVKRFRIKIEFRKRSKKKGPKWGKVRLGKKKSMRRVWRKARVRGGRGRKGGGFLRKIFSKRVKF